MTQPIKMKNKQARTSLCNKHGQQMSHYALMMTTVLIVAITMQRAVQRSIKTGIKAVTDQALGGGRLQASSTAVPAGGSVTLSFTIPGAFSCTASGSSDFSGLVGQANSDGSVSGQVVVTINQPTTFVLSCDNWYTADPSDVQVYSVSVALLLNDSAVTSTQSVDETGTIAGTRVTATTEQIGGTSSARDIRIEPMADFGDDENVKP